MNDGARVWSKQAQFLRSNARFRAFIGGRGTGKTVTGAIAAMDLIYQFPDEVSLVTNPSHDGIRDSLLPICREYWEPIGGNFNNSPPYKCLFPNGHRVSFRSSEKPELQRGPSWSWSWHDEKALDRKGCWSIVLPGLRTRRGLPSRSMFTTTPKQRRKGRDDLKSILKRNRFDVVTASTWENPFTSRQYKVDLLREYSGLFREQELEGRFVTLDAGVIKREWFTERIKARPPAGLRWVRTWDLAFSEKARADQTASIAAAMDKDGNLYLRDGVVGRWEWPECRRVILSQAQREKYMVGVEAVASQQMAWQDLIRDWPSGQPVPKPMRVDRDKLSRAMPWVSRAEAGRVYLIDGPWIEGWLGEWEEFPDGEHDDRVDAVSLAWELTAQYLRDHGWIDDLVGAAA